MKTIDGMVLCGSWILADLIADSMDKIASGRGSSKQQGSSNTLQGVAHGNRKPRG
jgi:hypothetical protein